MICIYCCVPYAFEGILWFIYIVCCNDFRGYRDNLVCIRTGFIIYSSKIKFSCVSSKILVRSLIEITVINTSQTFVHYNLVVEALHHLLLLHALELIVFLDRTLRQLWIAISAGNIRDQSVILHFFLFFILSIIPLFYYILSQIFDQFMMSIFFKLQIVFNLSVLLKFIYAKSLLFDRVFFELRNVSVKRMYLGGVHVWFFN